MVAYTKPQQGKKEESERLSYECQTVIVCDVTGSMSKVNSSRSSKMRPPRWSLSLFHQQ